MPFSADDPAGLRRGDAAAIDRLYRDHAAGVLGWALRLGGPRLDAEAVAHDTLLAAARKLPAWRGGASPSAWLLRLTRRTIAWARVRAWLADGVGAGATVGDDTPRDRARRALDALPTDERLAVVLCDLDDRPIDAAAALLGDRPAAILARLHRGRARLAATGVPLADLADATAPTDAEVARLRARAPAPERRWPALLGAAGALAVAFAVATVAVTVSRPDYAAPGTFVDLDDGALPLTPFATLSGDADVHVLRAAPDGTVVGLGHGATRLVATLQPADPPIVLHNGDLDVEVRDGDVVVHLRSGTVDVHVERGTAVARTRTGVRALVAGEGWTWPEPNALPNAPRRALAAAEDTNPPPAPPAEPVTEDAALQHALSLEAAGRPRHEAIAAWDGFLARFPASPYAEEASVRRLTLRLVELPPERRLAEVEAWLQAWPDGAHRAELLERAATIAKDELRDCERALPFYAALADPRWPPQRRARTQAARGLCLSAAGDADAARLHLDDALALGVSGPLRDKVVAVREGLAIEAADVEDSGR